MSKLKKATKTIFWIFAIIGILFFLMVVYFAIFPDEYFQFKFSSTEDGSPINGEVYLNGFYLGETRDGKLKANVLNLTTGELMLTGFQEGKPFELYWDFKGEVIQYGEHEFIASSQDFIDATFDASELDLNKVEKEILDLVNLERQKYPKSGIRSLRWNDKISEIAREHSRDMLDKEYFSHRTLEDVETLESVDFTQRLKNENIFYVVSNENLILLPVYPDTDIAKESVEGWLESPGHRSTLLDLDNLYSDAGVGISCEKNLCYVTMDFISLRYLIETDLNSNSCWAVPIYDESFYYDLPININLKLDSTSSMDVYVTKQSQFDRCISNKNIDATKKYRSVKKIDENIEIEKGDVVLFSTKSSSSLNLSIDYLTN